MQDDKSPADNAPRNLRQRYIQEFSGYRPEAVKELYDRIRHSVEEDKIHKAENLTIYDPSPRVGETSDWRIQKDVFEELMAGWGVDFERFVIPGEKP